MNKRTFYILLTIFTLVFSNVAKAQIIDPVRWSTSIEKISETEFDLIIEATIDAPWHLYSQILDEGGPIATTFTFTESDDYTLVGTPTEEEGHSAPEPAFNNMMVKYFENSALFKQRIKIVNKEISLVNGEVGYMVCNDTQCLAPVYKDLAFSFNTSKATTTTTTTNKATDKAATKGEKKKGLWNIFLLAFGAGFIAIFTPCVFPMIPMTVSFFTKQSKSKAAGIKNAFIYGLSIIVIYVLLGTIVTAIFGASALNELSTNVWFNVIFFFILVLFAFSFLGAFEIMLPNSWANKVDKQADRGGLTGIFFMALALAIVSFSCTGPVAGFVLVEAATKGGIFPIIGMLGFALPIALVFMLFAAFPGWLNSLPKSGGWLNSVKVVLGFLELALAFKFLSNADMVLQLHWLEREVFIAIWIAIFAALSFYLFGKIQLPHDSPLKHISVGRLSLGLLTLAFTIYMIPGLWGAPLNLISAFPPPQHYSESPYGVGYTRSGGSATQLQEIPDGGHLMAPHNILAFNDYEKGLAYAKKVNKPVMLDFTGHACVNCRKMEQNVWVKDKVLTILKNDVVLISLYVDEKLKFEGEAPDSKLRPGKKLRYTGQQWSELQQIRFGTNAQPYYVLMGHDEENLNEAVGYTPDVEEYHLWLEDGITNFKSK
ncbi:thioredoxin family protein [Cellulophaga sp. F20128]|uniref:protein-disulfide reductase DsbD family protein n=1 Tax=Cellulophaga sp. F20128 TaxID=2926413 RepID=UPI001FF36A96|nr:thioredoxin family protein [Cellulophaga sp. F20128]MCK0156904.1 thioredoxin family protein [Cellulophaga sp. F20128]